MRFMSICQLFWNISIFLFQNMQFTELLLFPIKMNIRNLQCQQVDICQ